MSLHRNFYLSLYLGLTAALFSLSCHPSIELDLTANIINNTCNIEVSDGGTVTFRTVGLGYFVPGITSESDYEGGEIFSIKLLSCPVSDNEITKVTFEFTPQSGQFAIGNQQVFANELTKSAGGAENVGVVIFTTDVPRKNVLNTDGTSRATFSATSYSDTSWTFYSRMQKILDSGTVTPGQLSSHVLVNVTYQ
ncbi:MULTISPECIES: fimbrial-like protein [Citrobacter]|uniref:fimbrial-like protein n=1 Tax=Citrobacter TaxID=544 RepID=UPI00019B190A|nr:MULTISPECIES: fimbrial-like protein [Citrobacter]MBJ8835363.1 fimbrial protein [Citrobacter freundii]EEH95087.1 hypothetical protein CSAG_03441 [Citrobacter portucalensis]ETX65832.1 hypothetical protein P835_00602 [Citrobacter portucalensis]MBD9983431.1 fimbrial protein [Citrobacter portucalensis]MBE0032938.1 fimbrial protein [Citrobacter portucalensis]